tara:strand:- start:140 stop:433 length:294 start_codon:yes stop_codon:yes gene_type:complete
LGKWEIFIPLTLNYFYFISLYAANDIKQIRGGLVMSNESIMIVEDENFVARDLQMSLEDMGYTVDSMVPSGEQAIREIEEKRSDIVLMDIVLQYCIQ